MQAHIDRQLYNYTYQMHVYIIGINVIIFKKLSAFTLRQHKLTQVASYYKEWHQFTVHIYIITK